MALSAPEMALDGFEVGSRRLRGSTSKRLVDFAGALFGLIFLAPFLLLVAFAIRLDSPGQALYRQRRTGQDGRVFVILKFRTMTVLEQDQAVVQARKNDCRITRIGALLRRTSIDELPQLLNVLVGDMSLVGPRPHALKHDHYYSAVVSHYDRRFAGRPGITGLAQVSGCRGETSEICDMSRRVAYDLEYIRRWSLLLDIEILLRTLRLGPFDPAAY
jgi:putative colanic acid biosynthesis UDP-glucose lipid carrier transferase